MGLNLKHAYRFAVEEQSQWILIYRERCAFENQTQINVHKGAPPGQWSDFLEMSLFLLKN